MPSNLSVITQKKRHQNDALLIWLRELDLNQRPSGYEPDELPSCSIPRRTYILYAYFKNMSILFAKKMFFIVLYCKNRYFNYHECEILLNNTFISIYCLKKHFP